MLPLIRDMRGLKSTCSSFEPELTYLSVCYPLKVRSLFTANEPHRPVMLWVRQTAASKPSWLPRDLLWVPRSPCFCCPASVSFRCIAFIVFSEPQLTDYHSFFTYVQLSWVAITLGEKMCKPYRISRLESYNFMFETARWDGLNGLLSNFKMKQTLGEAAEPRPHLFHQPYPAPGTGTLTPWIGE